MSGETNLVAKNRSVSGTANCRRLRNAGQVPGNVYGHKEGAVAIQASHDDVYHIVSEGHQAVNLDVEGKGDVALFREVQWDTFSRKILHFDLVRVDANEKIELDVPVEIRGTAPGIAEGGILDVQLHTLQVECLVYKIPASIVVRIGSLHMEDSIRVEDLKLPEGIAVLDSPDSVVVQVNKPRAPKEDEEETAEGEEGAEPAVVGEGDSEEGDDEKSED